jgi:hypothetical protein
MIKQMVYRVTRATKRKETKKEKIITHRVCICGILCNEYNARDRTYLILTDRNNIARGGRDVKPQATCLITLLYAL